MELNNGGLKLQGWLLCHKGWKSKCCFGYSMAYSIRTYSTNHREKLLSFHQYGWAMTLKWLKLKSIQTMDSKLMSKLLKKAHFSFMAHLSCMEATPPQQTCAPHLSTLLQKYKVVFHEMPTRCPPNKGMGHLIKLDPTKGPIIMCPYQYQHFHMSKIESLMKEFFWGCGRCVPNHNIFIGC